MMVDRAAEHRRISEPYQVDVRCLAQGMYARIGPPRAVDRSSFSTKPGDRGFEGLLHRERVRLPLPADQPGAVVLDRQLVAGHGSTVPGVSRKPRRNSGASS